VVFFLALVQEELADDPVIAHCEISTTEIVWMVGEKNETFCPGVTVTYSIQFGGSIASVTAAVGVAAGSPIFM
jgi:hypothetical protein